MLRSRKLLSWNLGVYETIQCDVDDIVVRLVHYIPVLYLCDVGVWHLVETEVLRKEVSYCVRPGVNYPQLFFVLYLQRKPHYYIIHITLPCIFLTFIAILVRYIRLEVAPATIFR